MVDESCVNTAINACVQAGRAVLEVYGKDRFDVSYKSDNSPLTVADTKSHGIISSYLRKTGIPVLSEEGRDIPYSERSTWKRLWIVDPLDGTKEFIKRNGEFTINIALVEDRKVVFGTIFIPARDTLYVGAKSHGSYRIDDPVLIERIANGKMANLKDIISSAVRLPDKSPLPGVVRVVGSRSHLTAEVEEFVRELKKAHKKVEFVQAGSSLKLCLVAEGNAELYPRLGPTMEWDIAAGHAIAENAGAQLLCHDTGAPLEYNKEDLLNPWFVVKGAAYRSREREV